MWYMCGHTCQEENNLNPPIQMDSTTTHEIMLLVYDNSCKLSHQDHKRICHDGVSIQYPQCSSNGTPHDRKWLPNTPHHIHAYASTDITKECIIIYMNHISIDASLISECVSSIEHRIVPTILFQGAILIVAVMQNSVWPKTVVSQSIQSYIHCIAHIIMICTIYHAIMCGIILIWVIKIQSTKIVITECRKCIPTWKISSLISLCVCVIPTSLQAHSLNSRARAATRIESRQFTHTTPTKAHNDHNLTKRHSGFTGVTPQRDKSYNRHEHHQGA